MTRTLDEFHGFLADMLTDARNRYDMRPRPGEPGYLGSEANDVVSAWRHLTGLISDYANGAAGVRGARPTWEAFWADRMDRAAFLRLIAGRSRITRATSEGWGMDAPLFEDSVRVWEYDLTVSIMTGAQHLESAKRYANAELAEKYKRDDAVRRLGLELETSLKVAHAYTGVGLTVLRERAQECGLNRPAYPKGEAGARVWEPHPLMDMITAYRPTV